MDTDHGTRSTDGGLGPVWRYGGPRKSWATRLPDSGSQGKRRGSLSFRRCGSNLEESHGGSPHPRVLVHERGFCRPEKPRCGVCAFAKSIPLDGRRAYLYCHQGRTWRRRLPHRVDRSDKFATHHAGCRPGRDDQPQRRPVLEHVVQPANGAILSARDRSPVSLLGVWAATGQRHSGHRQPRKQWTDHGA